jgi:Ca-activated chloride channel family protein
MHAPRLTPDDPRLTAYALGELSGDERAAVEAAFRRDPALRAAVEEIRLLASQIEGALAADAVAGPAAEPVVSEPKRAGRRSPFFGRGWPKAMPPRTRRRRGADERVAAGDEKAADRGNPEPYAEPRSSLISFPQFYYVVGAAAAACFALLVAWRAPSAGGPVNRPAPTETTAVRELALAAPVVEAAAALAVAEEGAAPETPRLVPAFVESDLTLLAQARRGEALSGESVTESVPPARAVVAAPGRASEPAPLAVAAGSLGEPESPQNRERLMATREAAPAVVAAAAPAADGMAKPAPPRLPVEPIGFTAIPPEHADVLASSIPLGSLVSSSPALALASVPASGPLGSDPVVLSAMRVTASRAVGFALPSESAGSRGHSGIYDRDLLPRPPPGAQFARGRDAYAFARDNDFVPVGLNPLSTFSIDVDTASYANVRRILNQGTPPPRDAVRIEELLNYFPYRYAAPRDGAPLAATLEVASAPWNPAHRLVRIGLKAHEVPAAQRPPASLVFLLDVSSSMNQPNKLPLVKQSLRLLIGRLRPDDRVAIVTYAGNSGLVLPSTPVAQARHILNALDALTPGGGSNGSTGIQLAYDVAQANFRADGTNRIILCTDGDFDLGITSEGDLVRLVEQKARTGVNLTVLGFGMGNFKDAQLERLAQHGNGNYGYIDTHREAEKLLGEQVSSTLVTVARDVKVQVEFNPARVASYRLIGYENRLLRREDFNHESFDAGEIGAGHTVTALYEVVPLDADPATAAPQTEKLRYGRILPPPAGSATEKELLTVKVRYKKPNRLVGWPRALDFSLVDPVRSFGEASADFRFAAAVAQFGMILRNSPHRGTATLDEVASWAAAASGPGDDPGGYRQEFIELVRKALTVMD